MGSARRSKRTELEAYLDEARPALVTEALWAELLARFAPVSEGYLRRLLRRSGVAMAPLVEGVRQDSFEELERTLLALGGEYAAATEAANSPRARACRRLVIETKNHARFAIRRGRDAEAKREMALWTLTWLENPGVFPVWVEMRKRATSLPPS